MKSHLEIIIPDHNAFYSLYADGFHSWKTYDQQKKHTFIYYAPGSVVVLYYTYITFREACVIRYTQNDNSVILPGLSKKVSVIFRARASRVDKLRRAVGWLKNHSSGAFSHADGFYIRLSYLLEQRGKLNYTALGKLAESSPRESIQFIKE